MAFAAGWAPCIGPILATAAVSGTAVWGAVLLVFYSLGLGLPWGGVRHECRPRPTIRGVPASSRPGGLGHRRTAPRRGGRALRVRTIGRDCSGPCSDGSPSEGGHPYDAAATDVGRRRAGGPARSIALGLGVVIAGLVVVLATRSAASRRRDVTSVPVATAVRVRGERAVGGPNGGTQPLGPESRAASAHLRLPFDRGTPGVLSAAQPREATTRCRWSTPDQLGRDAVVCLVTALDPETAPPLAAMCELPVARGRPGGGFPTAPGRLGATVRPRGLVRSSV